ncbi:MAG: hypothetical protein LUC17_02680 [Oscillospiraceae bacterium]|nr:hypothetical protein [Oscillospiraceae bacterium]
MIQGETATLYRKVSTGTDEMGEPIVEWAAEELDNVLFSQAYENENYIIDGTRPDGTIDTATLHVPKTFTDSLKNCEIEVQGARWTVIGDGKGYMPENTPGPWNRPIKLRRVDG